MTETKDDAAGLVARLIRAADRVDAIFDPNLGVLWREAADALTAAEARIAGLEAAFAVKDAALEPFDDALGEDDEGYGDGLTVVLKWGACTDYSVTLADLREARRAREALSRQEGGR